MNTTPAYRVEFDRVICISEGRRVVWTSQAWDTRRDGRPTIGSGTQRLETFLRKLEESTLPGECNAHLGITRITAARIVRQATGETVAAYNAPAFEVA